MASRGRARLAAQAAVVIAMLASSMAMLGSSPAGAGTIVDLRASGRAVYHDASGNAVPIAGARVQLCDDDFPLGDCELMDEGRTAADGTFDLVGTGGDIDGGPDVYVRAIAETEAGSVQLDLVFANYCMASQKFDDYDATADGFEISLGDLSPANASQCFPLGSAFGNVATEEAAWQLLARLQPAHDYAESQVGPMGPVAVLWPSDWNGVPWYNPLFAQIRVNSDWGDDVETLWHEYGHHVLYTHGESPLPDYNNDICDETNPLAFLPFFGGHCIWNEERGEIHWTEGFPTFFSMAVSEEAQPNSTPYFLRAPDGVTQISYELPWLSDGSAPSPTGESASRIEGWATATLYDLWDEDDDNHDADSDPHKSGDRLSFDFEEIWDAVEIDPDPADQGHDHATTIRELHDGLVELHPSAENRINGLFTENLIAYRGADLTVSDVQAANGVAEVDRGGTLTLGATTLNAAGARTGTDLSTSTGFNLIDESGPEPVVLPILGGLVVTPLDPGESQSLSAPMTIPIDTPPGTYRLQGCADTEEAVFETADPGLPFDAMVPNCADGPLLTVRNQGPTADAGGPYTFPEGVNVLSAAGSSDPEGDPLTYLWESRDGGLRFPRNEVEVEIDDLDDGLHLVDLTVSDGFDSSVDIANVTITNVAPTVLFVVGDEYPADRQLSADEGSLVSISAVAIEPGPDLLTATVSWGDGASDDLGSVADRSTFSFTHRYDDEGDYDGQVCVTDDDGAASCADFAVDVTNVAPELAVDPVLVTGAEGGLAETTVAFTDPGTDNWTASFDFGDGTTPFEAQLDGRSIIIDHVYAQDGSYTGEVCVDDGDGGTSCSVLSATVTNVAPILDPIAVAEPIVARVKADVTISFADPGVLDGHSAAISWGDGSSDDPAALIEPTAIAHGSVSGNHVFAAAGVVDVSICIADELQATCEQRTVDVLSPAAALDQLVNDLADETDPAVQDALVHLNGTHSRPRGALQRLESGDVVAAVTKIARAIEDLESATNDRSAEIRTLVSLAESVAREQLEAAEGLGLTSQGDLKKLAKAGTNVANGRTAFEAADYGPAVDFYRTAVQLAVSLL